MEMDSAVRHDPAEGNRLGDGIIMIRKEHLTTVYLARHTEAYKNLAKVHGGGDQRLTPRGVSQAEILGSTLAANSTESEQDLAIIHQPEGRSKATAQVIGAVASKPLIEVPALAGVSLGIVEGLSEPELAERYPEVASALATWRTSDGSLDARPPVPGSERMEEFADRVHTGLVASIDGCGPHTSLAVVGTTSTLNMLNHLLINDGSFVRPSYDFIHFPLGSYATWEVSSAPPKNTLPITICVGVEGDT